MALDILPLLVFTIAEIGAQSHGIEKLPSSKKLQAEINSLTAEKNGIYNTYREQRERVRELQTVKSNIDHILRREQSQRKKQEIDR